MGCVERSESVEKDSAVGGVDEEERSVSAEGAEQVIGAGE